MDSADEVYKAALTAMGKADLIAGVHASAFRAILASQPKPTDARRGNPVLAVDSAPTIPDFAAAFPNARVIHQG
jgi:hypothetical protein